MGLQRVIASLPGMQWLCRTVGGRDMIPFDTSSQYWEDRYAGGGNSGAGFYGDLAAFKADVLNRFVAEFDVGSVLEFGCGDGAQLERAVYPSYVGVDVSPTAIALCEERFRKDPSKRFCLAGVEDLETAELTLSLDVIYHLVEDDVFNGYMRQLFASSSRFVAIYSSNHDACPGTSHVRHRCFVDWIEDNAPEWRLFRKLQNAYPFEAGKPKSTSFADFYFFVDGSKPLQADG